MDLEFVDQMHEYSQSFLEHTDDRRDRVVGQGHTQEVADGEDKAVLVRQGSTVEVLHHQQNHFQGEQFGAQFMASKDNLYRSQS